MFLAGTTIAWAASRPPPHPRGGRASLPRAELGFQVDPLATSSSLIVFGAYGGLQLKISRATSKRLERDAAAETLRKARVLQLAGKMTTDEVERVAASWQEAAEVYERERVIFGLQGVQLRLPDPSRAVEPENDVASDAEEEGGAAEQPAAMQEQQQRRAEGDALTPVRRALGLRDAGAARSSSLLPTGSARVTIKDVAIGLVCQMDESAVLPARGERPSRPRLVAPTAPFAPTQLRAPPQQLGGWWRPPHGPRAVCGAVCPCAPQVFLLQLGWLALSLTDPLDAPGQNPVRRRPSARPADAPPSGRPCGCGAVYRAGPSIGPPCGRASCAQGAAARAPRGPCDRSSTQRSPRAAIWSTKWRRRFSRPVPRHLAMRACRRPR